jgi:hypothetical protein
MTCVYCGRVLTAILIRLGAVECDDCRRRPHLARP